MVNRHQQPFDGGGSELDFASETAEGALSLCDGHQHIAVGGVDAVDALGDVVARLRKVSS